MVDQSKLRAITLFFYFSLLDEPVAIHSTIKVLQKINEGDDHQISASETQTIVSLTSKEFESQKKKRKKIRAAMSYDAGWVLPGGIDLGIWKQFLRDTDTNEVLAVLYSRVLKFSDKDIAIGLGISEGTVRHRVARGLRALGAETPARKGVDA